MKLLNYLYYKKPDVSPLEYLSSLAPEEIYRRVSGNLVSKPDEPTRRKRSFLENLFENIFGRKGKDDLHAADEQELSTYTYQMEDYEAALTEGEKLRLAAAKDPGCLLRCLGGKPLSSSEIEKKREEGYISDAEIQLYHLLLELTDDNWQVFHQVDIDGLQHPVDIIAVSSHGRIYAVEIDGPHHLFKGQHARDMERETLLLKRGAGIIRVGCERFAGRYAQTAHEIYLLLEGEHRQEYPDQLPLADEDTLYGSEPEIDGHQDQAQLIECIQEAAILPDRYCFIYCQTTGIDEQDQCVDFCLVLKRHNGQQKYYTTIKPGCPIGNKASSLHGINERMVKDSPTLPDYLEQHDLKQLLEDRTTLAVTYDWRFMEKIIKNSAPGYLNWQKIHRYSVVDIVRQKYNLPFTSTIADALSALGIGSSKYRRYHSKDYADLVEEMFTLLYAGKLPF